MSDSLHFDSVSIREVFNTNVSWDLKLVDLIHKVLILVLNIMEGLLFLHLSVHLLLGKSLDLITHQVSHYYH